MKWLYGSKITVVLIIVLVFGLTADIANAKVLADVGANITEGRSLSAGDSYPAQRQGVLRQYDSDWEVSNFGVYRAVVISKAPLAAYIDTNAFKLALACEPDIVVVQLGGNDSLPGMWARKASFVSDFIALINVFTELPNQPLVFIWLPTPIFSSPYRHNNNVVKNEIVPLIQQLLEQREVYLIDLYTPFEDKAHLFPDGIHPNAEGIGLIVEIVAAVIINLHMPPDFNGGSSVDVQDLVVLAEHLFEGAGLVAHWALDETKGDIAYDSVGNIDAAVYNGQWTAGKIGGAQRISRERFRLWISSLGANTRFYNGKIDDVRIYT
jgi:acyl-CoA thioesterase-1